MGVNFMFSFGPRESNAAKIAMLTNPPMNAYSIVVAARSSLQNLRRVVIAQARL